MLEIWEARRLDRRLEAGRTRPAILECVLTDQDATQTRLMVVKAMGPPEVTETGLVCEMFGNLVARELGVLAPECAIVNISPEVAATMQPYLDPPGFQAGFGVGSEYMRAGMTAVIPDMTLLPEEVVQAARLYAFDLLVQNPDRREDNPNCAFIGKDIYAYDFETCFSFLYALLAREEPWEVSKLGIAERHIFYGPLHTQIVNWKPFLQDLSHLTEDKLVQMTEQLPLAWQDRTAKMRAHLLSAAAHSRELEMELQRSIA